MKIIDINGTQRNAKKVYPDPDYPGFMRVQFRRHHEWYSIKEFIALNPDLEDLTKSAPDVPEDIVGVVSSAGKDYLRDSSQKWKENEYMGFYVWISRGPGEGQKRSIVNNTHNKMTVDKPWDKKPNKASQYVVSHNVQDVRAMGNTLPEEDMKEVEKKALKMDKERGQLTLNKMKNDYKYLDQDEM